MFGGIGLENCVNWYLVVLSLLWSMEWIIYKRGRERGGGLGRIVVLEIGEGYG